MSRVSRLLNATVDVWRATIEDDGGGGQVETWSRVASPRCRLSQPSASEREQAAQDIARLTHVVYFEPTADVIPGDELRQHNALYEVTAVFGPSESGTYLRANCHARQPYTGGP